MNHRQPEVFISRKGLTPATESLYRQFQQERLIFDCEDPEALGLLRADAERIAAGMDDPECAPPMLWSGVPWPGDDRPLRSDYCLSISVGGSKTVALLLRIEGEEVVALGPGGEEVCGSKLEELAKSCSFATPTAKNTPDGYSMIAKIAEGVCDQLGDNRAALGRCANIVLSWAFASSIERTREDLLGGLAARTTLMTKKQGPFTEDLRGKDLCALFAQAFEEVLGHRWPVTVVNDGVMALHYLLGPRWRNKYARIGLFINGTGCNFALAEPYAVRPEGIVSAERESYEPRHLLAGEGPAAGERVVNYIVNYEIGSIDLVATRSRFDISQSYPIQTNALSGGNAFGQQFGGLGREFLGEEFFHRLLAGYRESGSGGELPGGPQISTLATVLPDEASSRLAEFFPGVEMDGEETDSLVFLCRAIVDRSALHAALLLSAVSFRTGFGFGQEESGLGDLLGMEGSIWSIEGYPRQVLGYWEGICGERKLNVELAHEPGFNASLQGPAFLAAIHAQAEPS